MVQGGMIMGEYVISVRNVTKGEFGSEPGPTRFLVVPANKNDTALDQQVARSKWVDAVLQEAQSRNSETTGRPLGDILVFVHGYNNSPPAVLKRHRLLKKDMKAQGYKGAVVSFDWPSASMAINYLEDRSDAKKTAIRLVDDCIALFSAVQARGCEINVHLLAHSTGAFIIREAFDDADDRIKIASTNWSVSQIAFIGADVSAKSMSTADSKSDSIYRHCVRLTNYSNPYDAVLKLSNIKRIGVSPRVGRVGLPEDIPSKAVNVDCGSYFKTLIESEAEYDGSFSHSWHIGDDVFAKDLYFTIQGDIDRNRIPTRRMDDRGRLALRK
jgi:esterase/lipase superfamily enzyme